MSLVVRTVHTADLTPGERAEARRLMEDVFEGGLTPEDWDHCLGGLHVLGREGGELVGHAALVQRHLGYDGRVLRAGYVEGLGVRADRRRRGYAGVLMAEAERVIDAAYDLGALGASEDGMPFYRQRGWLPWTGPTSALTPGGVVRTEEEDGWILVRPGAVALDTAGGALTVYDWRDGDVW
ncbi:GNAT family N-acetyltransferase [Kitasatospora terrestris]|uniref:Aminoglycoside N-acetyltransferase AAC(2')-Ic n=1 Tax=Kitasatospora terrestris TaxID=258051 RepID=A0ABP9DFE4_9ACTN